MPISDSLHTPALSSSISYLSLFNLFSVPFRPPSFGLPNTSPVLRPSPTAGYPRSAPSQFRTSVSLEVLQHLLHYLCISIPGALSRCPSCKYICIHLSLPPSPHLSVSENRVSSLLRKVRLKLTASGYSVLSTTPASPPSHTGALSAFLSRTKRTPLLNLGWRKGRVKAPRVWVGPVPKAGLGREGRGGERV